MKKVLIINAHQKFKGISEGELNKSIAEIMTDELKGRGFLLKHTNIEDGYELEEEQEKHLWADFIIIQSPVYWFGTPWLHKKYMDEVFTDAIIKQTLLTGDGRTRQDLSKQYGTGGKMEGKKMMLSLTWNAPKEAFDDQSQYLLEGKGVDDVFFPIHGAYRFCGAESLPTFSCYNVMKSPDIENDMIRLKGHLDKFIN
jgi:modulator of drug activity B